MGMVERWAVSVPNVTAPESDSLMKDSQGGLNNETETTNRGDRAGGKGGITHE